MQQGANLCVGWLRGDIHAEGSKAVFTQTRRTVPSLSKMAGIGGLLYPVKQTLYVRRQPLRSDREYRGAGYLCVLTKTLGDAFGGKVALWRVKRDENTALLRESLFLWPEQDLLGWKSWFIPLKLEHR